MTLAPVPTDDTERLRVLHALGLDSDAADPALAALTRLASRLTSCPVAAIGLVDAELQWFVAPIGLGSVAIPRDVAFCAHAIGNPQGLVVNDARLDPRFTGNPLLAREPPLSFYAGMPISVYGHRMGCICVMDSAPRSLEANQLDALRELATLCGALLDARLRQNAAPAPGGVPPAELAGLPDWVTQRVLAAEARERQATDLANRAKTVFLSRVSHEMRTPLNAVIGFTQLLRLTPGGAGPAQVTEYTDHVLRASEHLLALINDLLDLQRVEERRLTLQLRPLALTPLVGAAFSSLQPLARQHGVTLQNEVDRSLWVRADAQLLRQVLINIVSNAIKYNRSGGRVQISALPGEGGQIVLEVDDTGSGLTQDQLARLFQPFERLGHESSGIEGSGLGLVIARRLVEAMGGGLTLSSVPSSGTRVRIALPAAEAPASEPHDRAIEPMVRAAAQGPVAQSASGAPHSAVVGAARALDPALLDPTQGVRMLYVEDNRINAILFEEAVRLRGGIELQVAEDGAEALALVAQWLPEVLVLDANLPDMSGYEVLTRLRKMPALASVPAFMCSADAMEADKQRAAAAGFIGYWTKPIDIGLVMRDLDRLRLRPPAE